MTSATYTVTENGDLDLVVQLFHNIRGIRKPRGRFEWLYSHNPTGEAIVWVLRDPAGKAVGFTACYPRAVWVQGRVCRALNCGDSSVDVSHRTLGPAVMLRRAAKALVDSGKFAFLYSHPMPAMLPVHIRLGHSRLSEMTRWVYPLRAQELLHRRLGRRTSSVVAPLANIGLRVRRFLQQAGTKRFGISEVKTFSPEYDRLDQLLGQHYRVIGRRTQAHLAWRFVNHPDLNTTIVEARDSCGSLVGYLVLELNRPTSKVHDLAYLPNMGVERALLLHAMARAEEAGAHTLIFVVQKAFPGTWELRRLGFWERAEQQPTVCYGGKNFWGKASVEQVASWFMTVGDRDV